MRLTRLAIRHDHHPRELRSEIEERIKAGEGPVTPDGDMERERFRVVVEGPPNWTSFRQFWKMFSDEGAVAVASTYTKVGGVYDTGFRHDPSRPLETLAEYCLGCYTNLGLPTRIKLLVHDGFGVWCAARRLNAGRFDWPRQAHAGAVPMTLTQQQFDALVSFGYGVGIGKRPGADAWHGFGGGMFVEYAGSIVVRNAIFENNRAVGSDRASGPGGVGAGDVRPHPQRSDVPIIADGVGPVSSLQLDLVLGH